MITSKEYYFSEQVLPSFEWTIGAGEAFEVTVFPLEGLTLGEFGPEKPILT